MQRTSHFCPTWASSGWKSFIGGLHSSGRDFLDLPHSVPFPPGKPYFFFSFPGAIPPISLLHFKLLSWHSFPRKPNLQQLVTGMVQGSSSKIRVCGAVHLTMLVGGAQTPAEGANSLIILPLLVSGTCAGGWKRTGQRGHSGV